MDRWNRREEKGTAHTIPTIATGKSPTRYRVRDNFFLIMKNANTANVGAETTLEKIANPAAIPVRVSFCFVKK